MVTSAMLTAPRLLMSCSFSDVVERKVRNYVATRNIAKWKRLVPSDAAHSCELQRGVDHTWPRLCCEKHSWKHARCEICQYVMTCGLSYHEMASGSFADHCRHAMLLGLLQGPIDVSQATDGHVVPKGSGCVLRASPVGWAIVFPILVSRLRALAPALPTLASGPPTLASGFPPRPLERKNVIPAMAPVVPALAHWLPKASLWDQI